MSQAETYKAALENVVASAPANGEDISYLIAKKALAQPRSCRCGYKWVGPNRTCPKCHPPCRHIAADIEPYRCASCGVMVGIDQTGQEQERARWRNKWRDPRHTE